MLETLTIIRATHTGICSGLQSQSNLHPQTRIYVNLVLWSFLAFQVSLFNIVSMIHNNVFCCFIQTWFSQPCFVNRKSKS